VTRGPVHRLRRAAGVLRGRLRAARFKPRSELIIPVTCTERLLDLSSRGFPGAVACDHVTVLDPFVAPRLLGPAIEAAVDQVLREFRPFRYELARLGRFPGVLYLAPEPAEPFIAITEALHRRFPGYPPYGGAYERIVPHVTVALGPEPDGLVEHLQERLPLRGVAHQVWLKAQAKDGAWSVVRAFELGGRS
jgi:hypothetical protein